MIRTDLFTLANSGINASSQLLNTTSNNIVNVNTEGYVRERTVFESSNLGGVGQGSTERVLNTFAQNQMRRDITSVGALSTFVENTSSLDNLLASEANSLAGGMSQFFASLQTASDDPTNVAAISGSIVNYKFPPPCFDGCLCNNCLWFCPQHLGGFFCKRV